MGKTHGRTTPVLWTLCRPVSRMSSARDRRLQRRQVLQSAGQMLWLEKWRRHVLFWTPLREASDRRAVEGAVHTLHAEIDDMLQQAKNSEEKAKKAMVDAARLADELRAEQDHTNTQSKAKRALETQLQELENKFAEVNENAIRGGRAAMAKLESRIRELEIELGNVQAHTGENSKSYQKSERRVKELAFQIDEDKKNQERMSELATKLRQKIKTYKKQIEEAEEIAALNLAKFRKAQQELEETEERAKLAEAQMRI